METLRTFAKTARYAGRFTIVRVASRGSDLAISNYLILVYGESWFYPAIMLAAFSNVTIEYVGNKFWTFHKTEVVRRSTRKEIVLYLTLRGFYGIFGFLALFLLYKILSFPYFISSLVVASILWFLSFRTFKGLFSGIPRGLPRILRKFRIVWRQKRVRSV